nr:UBN2 domain-containing protein [Tanacetum cinerariifolium]
RDGGKRRVISHQVDESATYEKSILNIKLAKEWGVGLAMLGLFERLEVACRGLGFGLEGKVGNGREYGKVKEEEGVGSRNDYDGGEDETKIMKEITYELLKDDQNKKLGKNNEAKITLYSALPQKEYERVFMCKTAKERVKVMTIEEAKDLATLPLEKLIGNLKVYEMVLDNDGVASKTTKEKVKSLDLKAKVTTEQTSDDNDSQDGSDEDVDEVEEAEAFNLMARNFRKFFRKGKMRFRRT